MWLIVWQIILVEATSSCFSPSVAESATVSVDGPVLVSLFLCLLLNSGKMLQLNYEL